MLNIKPYPIAYLWKATFGLARLLKNKKIDFNNVIYEGFWSISQACRFIELIYKMLQYNFFKVYFNAFKGPLVKPTKSLTDPGPRLKIAGKEGFNCIDSMTTLKINSLQM